MKSDHITFKNSSLLPSGALFTVEVDISENGTEFIQSYIIYPDGTQGTIVSFTTQKSELLAKRVHIQKYIFPHPRAGDCYGPVYGECVDQSQIICVFSGDTTKEAEDYLKNNCKDAQGRSKKC